ncbi:VanZ family protein [Listeria ivanovii]|uniref:VanZ family protein n=1 Tax=Listeria ivanovii TaxID=1638 RepID=UPI00065E5DAE|nr:VanZ family protein [Listeria ivanovii]
MLTFSILVMMVALIVYIIFFLLRWLKKKEKFEIIIFKTCLYIYCCGVIKYTIFPIMVQPFLIEDTKKYITGPYMNLIPFKTISEMFIYSTDSDIFQVIANFIIFVPLGMILPLCYQKMTWKHVFLISLFATVGIELTQLLQDIIYQSPFKFVDIDDIILNFSGGIFGYLVFILLRPLLRKMGLYIDKCGVKAR